MPLNEPDPQIARGGGAILQELPCLPELWGPPTESALLLFSTARMTRQRLPPQPPQVLDLLLSAVSLQGTICHCYEEAGEAQSQGEPLPATQRSSKQIHLACWPQQQTAGDCCPRGSPGPWLRRAKDRHHSHCNNVGPTENGLPMRKPVLCWAGFSSERKRVLHKASSPTYKTESHQLLPLPSCL